MTSTSALAPAVWQPPSVRIRGTLGLVAGAGETPRVYERFGTRLSSDGYLVGVFETAEAAAAVAWLQEQDAAPRVLVGSDRGAAAVLSLVASGSAVDGVVIAGLPVAGVDDAGAPAAARTACPLHLGVLAEASARTGVEDTTIEIPDAPSLANLDVPVLAVHGGADEIAPFDAARTVLSALPRLELVETVDGLHDALNDQNHRSVAARLVLWLERLRAGDIDRAIVRDAEKDQA